jgi:nitroreductase
MSEIGLYEAMGTTRAVRRLRPDPIPDDVLRRVLEAATWAPSGGNRQPWRVIAVKDPAKKRVLRDLYAPVWQQYMKGRRKSVEALPAEQRATAERTFAAGDRLAETLHEVPVVCVFVCNTEWLAITDRELERPSVVGGGSLYPAVQNLLLACRAEGLGCVLTTLLVAFDEQISGMLELPEPWGSYAFVPIGYPVGRGHGPISRRRVEEVVDLDSWGHPLFS